MSRNESSSKRGHSTSYLAGKVLIVDNISWLLVSIIVVFTRTCWLLSISSKSYSLPWSPILAETWSTGSLAHKDRYFPSLLNVSFTISVLCIEFTIKFVHRQSSSDKRSLNVVEHGISTAAKELGGQTKIFLTPWMQKEEWEIMVMIECLHTEWTWFSYWRNRLIPCLGWTFFKR